MKIALIRGKFLTKYDMEAFEELSDRYSFTAFGSKTVKEELKIPQIKLLSPMDMPNFPFKMQILNRLFTDAHYLVGLDDKLKGFDIAHTSETYMHFTQQAIAAKKKGYVNKVVCTVFENIPFNNEGIRGRKRFKKNSIENIDHFIAVTEGAKSALVKEGVNPSKVSVVGMGIDTQKFKPPSARPNDLNLNILFVGRIEEFKGIFDALSAFSYVNKKLEIEGVILKFLIVGRGSKERELDHMIRALDLTSKVKRTSLSYSSLPQVYGEADIMIAPSKKDKYWKEQFGMVFLEAMASGLPTTAYKSGSVPEIVGDAALLSDEGDIKTLSENLLKLSTDSSLREKLSHKARKRAVSKFSLRVISKKIDKVYKSL